MGRIDWWRWTGENMINTEIQALSDIFRKFHPAMIECKATAIHETASEYTVCQIMK